MNRLIRSFTFLLCFIGITAEGYATPRTKLVSSVSNAFKKCYAPYVKRVFATSTEIKGCAMPNIKPRIKRDGDFKDLVTQSTIFADKSLFIKDVIEV